MFRSVLAVLAGAAAWAVPWVGGGQALAAAFPGQIQDGVPLTHAGILWGLIGFSVVLSLLAGYTTGRLAPTRPVGHAWILAGLQLALGVAFEAAAWESLPVWYHLVFLILLVPATVTGGRVASRR